MKRLIEGAHQISDDLIVANTVYSWRNSFWRITVHSLLGEGEKVGELSRWKQMFCVEIENLGGKKVLVSWFHINLHELFNAKAILAEEQ